MGRGLQKRTGVLYSLSKVTANSLSRGTCVDLPETSRPP